MKNSITTYSSEGKKKATIGCACLGLGAAAFAQFNHVYHAFDQPLTMLAQSIATLGAITVGRVANNIINEDLYTKNDDDVLKKRNQGFLIMGAAVAGYALNLCMSGNNAPYHPALSFTLFSAFSYSTDVIRLKSKISQSRKNYL